MKKSFVKLLLSGAMVLAGFAFVGCNDLTEEMTDLSGRVEALEKSVADLQKDIDAGAVITNVETVAEGVKVTLSNGNTFLVKNGADGAKGDKGDKGDTGAAGANGTNGTNGKDGKDGKDATVWTIGEDGYWYQDGKKTDYKAVGADGANGENGANGFYYVPNEETGCFDKYQINEKGEPEFVEATTISWQASGVTAVLDGDVLKLFNVEGAEGAVEIVLSAELNSIAYIPDVVAKDFQTYPTTEEEFYHIPAYITELKHDVNYKFIPQTMDASNAVELPYRLNPSNVKDVNFWGFINRNVITRSAADAQGLLSADLYAGDKFQEVKDGIYTVDVRYNVSKAAKGANAHDVVALMLGQGTDVVTTSDYVYVTSKAIDAVLVNSVVIGSAAKYTEDFYPRNYAINDGNKETDAFVKSIVPFADAAQLSLVYNDAAGLDLSKYVTLYSNTKADEIKNLDFEGVRYEFSLPEEYLASDDKKTNQQWFVTLDGSILTVNAANLTTGLTPAIGRTPVVRVDAYVCDNNADEYMVASAYIKVAVVKDTPVVVPPTQAGQITLNMPAKEFKYRDLKTAYTLAGDIKWEDFNTGVYGPTQTTAETFWNYYQNNYTVTVYVQKNGQDIKLVEKNNATPNTEVAVAAPGVETLINWNNSGTQTSYIKVSVNNEVKTQHTYDNVDGKGAKYTVEVKALSLDKTKPNKGDVVIKQVFYVLEECDAFELNPLYYDVNYVDKDTKKAVANAVVIKGQLNTTWEMSSMIREHFLKIKNATSGVYEDVFTYALGYNNVTAIQFSLDKAVATLATTATVDGTNVEMTGNGNDKIYLAGAMTVKDLVCPVYYETTLVNGEQCAFDYNVVFVNPFLDGTKGAVKMWGNEVGEVEAETMPLVRVIDTADDVIYSYDDVAGALVLSDKALNGYKVAVPTVSYAFATEAEVPTTDIEALKAQMSANSVLECNPTTGVVTWKNEGSTLVADHYVPVIATVTFDKLSVVKCVIDVTITKDK
ncbi:MAG: hypothetical protein IJZ70_04285 [Bacteroidales bacterium]|nr:hypothetical protein [Bacteroidales bacterium]